MKRWTYRFLRLKLFEPLPEQALQQVQKSRDKLVTEG
jgi:hypothetical protein